MDSGLAATLAQTAATRHVETHGTRSTPSFRQISRPSRRNAMKTLRLGDKNPDVAVWQKVLLVKVDGIFGPFTHQATIDWQTARGLVADGIVGPKTWGAIAEPPLPDVAAIRGTDVAFPIQGDLNEDVCKKMAEQGIRFAILRLMVGNETWSDQKAVKHHIARLKAHGILPTAYMFDYGLRHIDPKGAVDRFLLLLEGLGMNAGELPPAYDAEWPPPEAWIKDPDPTAIDWPDGTRKIKNGAKVLEYTWAKWGVDGSYLRDRYCIAMEHAQKRTGLRFFFYSYRHFLDRIEAWRAPELGYNPLWLADGTFAGRWATRRELARLKVPAPWDKITIVQHDGNGGLRLPNGVDADFNMFMGDDDELAALAAGTGVAGTPASVAAALPEEEATFDLTAAKQEGRSLLIEEEIARYRRDRVDIAA